MTRKVAKHGRNAGWWNVRDAIAAGDSFTNSNGSWYGRPGPAHQIGVVDHHVKDWRSALDADYVVYSYITPIAWRTNGQWITPDAKYSVTTSHHQGQTFTAISQL